MVFAASEKSINMNQKIVFMTFKNNQLTISKTNINCMYLLTFNIVQQLILLTNSWIKYNLKI
jgi:hypothetical protein